MGFRVLGLGLRIPSFHHGSWLRVPDVLACFWQSEVCHYEQLGAKGAAGVGFVGGVEARMCLFK